MAEMHFRQPGFTYSLCRPFTNIKKRIQKFDLILGSIQNMKDVNSDLLQWFINFFEKNLLKMILSKINN